MSDHFYLPDDDEAWGKERPNKSQLKREARALIDLGKKLAELDNDMLTSLQLPHELHQALLELPQMRQHGARKRHTKYIGKLLRQMDTTVLEQTIESLERKEAESSALFHQIERWRDRLIHDGPDVLTDFMHEYPQADAGQIRRLIRNAQQEFRQNKPPKSSRQLFQLLRDIIG